MTARTSNRILPESTANWDFQTQWMSAFLFTLKLMAKLCFPLTRGETAQGTELKIIVLGLRLNNKLMTLTKN